MNAVGSRPSPSGPFPVPTSGSLHPGQIQSGDAVEVLKRPDHDVTIALVFRALTLEPTLLPNLLTAHALPDQVKDRARRRLHDERD